MQVCTLGWKTDVYYVAKNGVIEERDRYIVGRMPSNPTFYWGNFLLYPQPPSRQTTQTWLADFQREFPGARHRCFGWDSQERGDPSGFVEHGFLLSDLCVLSASRLKAPRKNPNDVTIRRFESDRDWDDALQSTLRNASAEERGNEPAFRLFKMRRYQQYRAMQANGDGAWYGAYADEGLVGSLGLFGENGMGRFQQVEVDERYRRRGICSKMLFEASEDFRKGRKVGRLVILALNDNPNDAVGLYGGAGFTPAEQMWGVWKRP